MNPVDLSSMNVMFIVLLVLFIGGAVYTAYHPKPSKPQGPVGGGGQVTEDEPKGPIAEQ